MPSGARSGRTRATPEAPAPVTAATSTAAVTIPRTERGRAVGQVTGGEPGTPHGLGGRGIEPPPGVPLKQGADDGREGRRLLGRPDRGVQDGVQDPAEGVPVEAGESRWKGDAPLTAVHSGAPTDHRSAAGPAGAPEIRSGAVHSGEPTRAPSSVRGVVPQTWATPTSV